MRRFWSLVCACAMIIGMIPAMMLTASADEVTSGDYKYYLYSDGTISISEYYGSATTLTIPSKIDGHKVVRISGYSFEDNKTLKSVTVPSTVTDIGAYAFSACSALKTVSIPASVEYMGSNIVVNSPAVTAVNVNSSNANYCSVNGVLFTKDKKTVMAYPAGKSGTSYTIPSSVTTINAYAFYLTRSLKSVTIPSSVTEIGMEAFHGSGISAISIPSSVKQIGFEAFSDCDSLKTLKIPSGVTAVPDGLCEDCDALTSVTIPSGTTVIGSYAFADCDLLNGVTIPSKVTLIEYGAFRDCASLTSIKIPASVTNMEGTVFYNCDALKSVTLSSGLVALGDQVFYECDALTEVKLPNTVKTLGSSAFAYCDALKKVTLSSNLTSIENSTFCGCPVLTNVTIPSKVVSVGEYAFYDCEALTEAKLPNSVKSLGKYAFAYCDVLKSVTLSNQLTSIEDGTFDDCPVLTKVTIPNGVKRIGQYAFAWNEALLSVVIPKTVTTIDQSAFYSCDLLQTVYYAGTEAQWGNITVADGNDPLGTAAKQYNYVVAAITAEPATATYAKHNTYASLKLSAVGNGITYTWYAKDPGDTRYYKSSLTTNTYKAKMTSATSGRLVYCIVRDQYGNEVRSKTFVLRRQATITSEPATVIYAKKGATASIKLGAAGDGLTYSWYIKNEGGTKYSKSSVTSSTYSTKMSSTSKGRLVYCVVKDKYGKTVKSKYFLLREAASITTQPKNTTVAKGATARATVKASGDGLKYTWYFKDAGKTSYSKSSVTKSTYSVTMSSKTKNRLVYCVVKDKYGKSVKSTTVQLKMK